MPRQRLSSTKRYGKSSRSSAETSSLRLDVGGPDHLAPLFGFLLKPTRFFSKATRVLVTAIEETDVKRLICVTGFGAGDSRGHGGFVYNLAFHLLLGRVYGDKDVQE